MNETDEQYNMNGSRRWEIHELNQEILAYFLYVEWMYSFCPQ